MANIFFISDTHFNHTNIALKFTLDDGTPSRINPETGQAFSSVEEMNELIIKYWNELIHPHDKVYHMGDVIMGPAAKFDSILCRLNGKKRLLLGNHDPIKGTSLHKWFEKIDVWRIFKKENFVATHVPIYRGNFRHKVQFNLHGHNHNHVVVDEKGKELPEYINNCVELTGFKPRHMDEILDIIKERKKLL